MDGICVEVMADLATYFSVDCAATTLYADRGRLIPSTRIHRPARPSRHARALLTDGSAASTRIFDDSLWPPAIIFGWPALYWLMSHGASGLFS